MSDKLIELNCIVCGEPFMGEEPLMCCSGRDCGCMGMPVDPIVCSEKCYNNLPGQKDTNRMDNNQKIRYMTNKEIKDRIKILKKEIAIRNKELEKLNKKQVSGATDTHTRFQIWANNGLDKKTLGFLPDKELRKYVENYFDLGSMRGAIHLLEYDEFERFALSDDELHKDDMEEIERLKKDKNFCAACEQMIKENIDGFEIDW